LGRPAARFNWISASKVAMRHVMPKIASSRVNGKSCFEIFGVARIYKVDIVRSARHTVKDRRPAADDIRADLMLVQGAEHLFH
jgi:hypothetical protein